MQFQLNRRSLLKLACAGIAAPAKPAASETIHIGQSEIQVVFESTGWQLTKQQLLDWVSQCARAVAAYYGGLPVRSARLRLRCEPGRHGVRHGRTFGYQGALTNLSIGAQTTSGELDQDWMLVHEMVHWCFPSVEDRHHWIEEGIATYVEPIARAAIHNLNPQRVWGDMVRDMPQGVPEPGSSGLDFTGSWASTYWGGALFCLLADIEIRKQTHSKKGLQDSLRAIAKQGGVITADWPLDRALAVGDRAVGVPVLTTLHEQMGHHYLKVNLDEIWSELGVKQTGSGIEFDNTAPLASARRAIVPSE